MKRTPRILAAMTVVLTLNLALAAGEKNQDAGRIKNITLGLSAGNQSIRDDVFRQLYDQKGLSFRGELSIALPVGIRNFDAWLSFNTFSSKGKSSDFNEDLGFRMTTISAGLRFLYKISRFCPFIGAGVDFVSFKETYEEDFVISSLKGSTTGLHLQGGVYVDILSNLSLKGHLKLNIAKTSEFTEEVDLGGFEFGLGVAYSFNLIR